MARTLIMLMVCFLLGHATEALSQESLVISDDKLLISNILISGNDVTQESVIRRELVFSVGDTIEKMKLLPALQRSKDNLLNLALFNFVYLNIKHLENNRINVLIDVTERWYVWPVPILEYADRNFSTFIQNRDWDKINYGAWLKWGNFRGRNELLTGKVRLGYVKEYSLAYSKPNLGKKQNHGISAGFNMTHQNEVSIATVNNEPFEYRPQEKPAQIRLNAFAKYSLRRKYFTTHSLRFEYYDYRVSDSVAIINSNYLGGGNTSQNYFMLTYSFDYDIRDSKVYPLEGFNVRIRAEQIGLGLIPDFDYASFRLTGTVMFHQKLANRLYFYNATKGRYTSEKMLPHFLNQALGYHEFLSGYESYVIDGSDYVITKYDLKIQLVKQKSYTIPFIGMEQFNKIHFAVFANLFADAGYVNSVFPNPTNTMVNTWQFSAGVGIDLVTYYDQVFRIDYVINRYGEHGFFFHVETPFFRW
ncbi:MAG: BamA/TamA family outer membrane protein [Bacteroidales bacterium]|nr:BamA/TamA family outer membrane protein [Bacteroidales bacterium]